METTITAGTLKGRKLSLSKSSDVRPTQNKLRQAAFNMLLARVDITDAHVLDLCCGSGAYGIEALSRGAATAVLVDTDPATAASNLAALGLHQQASTLKTDAASFTPSTKANLLFADPPYASDILSRLLARHAILGTPNSFWLTEHETSNPPVIPSTLTILKQKNHGTKVLTLLAS